MVKKKKKRRILLKVVLAEAVILVVLFFVKSNLMLDKINYNAKDDKNIVQNKDTKIKGFRNIAIFGVDSRDNALEKSTHSDTIIIASINNENKKVKLASVYRDTYVNIIGEDEYNKINSAYFKGGYSTALSTINKNFDLNITEYVTVNFRAVVNMIDELGGITLDVTKEELKYLNGYVRELNRINGTDIPPLKSAGKQTVNGTQATAYARIRYTAGGDFKRAERQRIVVSKAFEKLKSSGLSAVSLLDEVLPQVSTNLKKSELVDLAMDVMSYDIIDQTGFPFEKDAHNYKKVSYVFPINLAENVTKLHEFLFNKTGYIPTQTVKEYSDYIESIRVQK